MCVFPGQTCPSCASTPTAAPEQTAQPAPGAPSLSCPGVPLGLPAPSPLPFSRGFCTGGRASSTAGLFHARALSSAAPANRWPSRGHSVPRLPFLLGPVSLRLLSSPRLHAVLGVASSSPFARPGERWFAPLKAAAAHGPRVAVPPGNTRLLSGSSPSPSFLPPRSAAVAHVVPLGDAGKLGDLLPFP